MTPIEAGALFDLLRRRSVHVAPAAQIACSRDPDDDKFLECAVAASADCIVSADADLLSLTELESIPIVDMPTFWRMLSEQPDQR